MNDKYTSATADANTSAVGYAWSNATEANYTFTIEAVNATGVGTNSSTNVSMYVDATAPIANFTGYTNASTKKNTDQLTLNISVADALSGLTNSKCKFDINGTNETIAVSSGWCNTTALNLTGLADGNQTIKIWANDTVNNIGVNLSHYFVQVDTTAPSPSASCSPSLVSIGESISCSCSSTDATSGVNDTLTTTSSTPSTSTAGTFTYSCNVIDYAGNSANSSTTYTVEQSATGGNTVSQWINTYIVTESLFEEGFNKEMKSQMRMKFDLNNEEHHVGVKSLTTDKVTIEIASDPIEILLGIGEDVKVDLTGDNFYDLYVLLNGIANNKADITIQKINEAIPEENKDSAIKTSGDILGQDKTPEEKSSNWVWWSIAIIILIALYWKKKEVKKLFK